MKAKLSAEKKVRPGLHHKERSKVKWLKKAEMISVLQDTRGVRKNLYGTPEKPRLCVFRSNKNIAVQIIDDVNGVTLAISVNDRQRIES